MKRRILIASFAAVLVISLCLVAFVACNPDDITHFRLDLNDKNADYTQEYREAHSIESRNIIKVVNKDLYKNFCTGLPTGNDMIAPSGKAFAGWYFDKNNYEGTEFSEYNWNRFQRDAEDGEKKYVLYARWIPQGQQVVYFDLANSNADFTAAYRASHNNFDHRSPEFIINNDLTQKAFGMPQEAHIVVPKDVTFEGWFFEDGTPFDDTPATVTHFVELVNEGQVQFKIVAHWQEKEKRYVTFRLPETIGGSGYMFAFASSISQKLQYVYWDCASTQVVRENYDELLAILPAAEDVAIKVLRGGEVLQENVFATVTWSIAVYNQETWQLESTLPLTEDNWLAVSSGENVSTIDFVMAYEFNAHGQEVIANIPPEA
ncbi:MAG: hypothetical protein J5815_02795 [Clostridia bacterium]|nr:hypothetical protein [Clostridia bacterium]